MKEWTYIEVNDTQRIAVAPSGTYYPQHLADNAWGSGEEWIYYDGQKRFTTENRARVFLAKHPAERGIYHSKD